MSEANSPVALARPLLARLAPWWRLFGRRADIAAILRILTKVETQLFKTQSSFQTSQDRYSAVLTTLQQIQREHDTVLRQHAELTQAHGLLKAAHTAISANFQDLERAHDVQGGSYGALLQKHAHLERAYRVSQDEKTAALENLHELRGEHAALLKSFDTLIQRHADLERSQAIMRVEHKNLQDAHDAQSIAHQQLQVTHGLISQVLGAGSDEHAKYLEFCRLFREDFMAFANAENTYERNAEAVQRLHAVADELRLLGRVPVFREKTIVAVAGGFSSGKSSFVSSYFDTNRIISLPIGIEPVTAIPTYVIHGDRARVVGFPAQGGAIDIAPDLYAQLKHEFVDALGFDLKRILPFIAIENPWREPMQHLCLIDTPGYNPAIASGQTETDGEATGDALRQADAVLWILGLDSNGEIPQSDLEYLTANNPGLPLGVVLNKADCRPGSSIESVIDQVSETLELSGIEYLGITAYSSVEQTEYACRGAFARTDDE